jgi:hypothetical protein
MYIFFRIFQSAPLKRRGQLEELGVGGRLILKLILDKLCMRVYVGFTWFRKRSFGGLL